MPEKKNTSAKVKMLSSLLKLAIEDERKIQDVYEQALHFCDKPIIKETLEKFYEDEVRHEKKLVEYYDQLQEEYKIKEEPLKRLFNNIS